MTLTISSKQNKKLSDCINEDLYKDMATRIAEDGFLEAGYNQVSIDDCWPNMERDAKTNRPVGNTTRFPSGIKALGDFMHSKKVRFGIYSDEGTKTCAVSVFDSKFTLTSLQ